MFQGYPDSAKWVFGKTINMTDLPSTSTVGRAQCLSKYQVTEGIVDSEMLHLNSDVTMRDGKKIVGTQVILDTGWSLSIGFKTVAIEDSSTLLDNAIAMIEELGDIYDADNRDHVSAAVRIDPKSTSQFPLQEFKVHLTSC